MYDAVLKFNDGFSSKVAIYKKIRTETLQEISRYFSGSRYRAIKKKSGKAAETVTKRPGKLEEAKKVCLMTRIYRLMIQNMGAWVF